MTSSICLTFSLFFLIWLTYFFHFNARVVEVLIVLFKVQILALLLILNLLRSVLREAKRRLRFPSETN